MEDNLFFRILRRLNLVLYAVIALGVLTLSGVSGWHAYKNGSYKYLLGLESGAFMPSPDITPAKDFKYDVALEAYRAPLDPSQKEPYAIFVLNRTRIGPYMISYEPQEAVNLMPLDDKTGAGSWLFKGTKRIITMRDTVHKGALPKDAAFDTREVTDLVLWVVDRDTNKDGQITVEDKPSVYVWRLGEKEAVKLLDTDGGLATGETGENRYNIVYNKGDKRISVTYSVPDFKIVSENVLPDPFK